MSQKLFKQKNMLPSQAFLIARKIFLMYCSMTIMCTLTHSDMALPQRGWSIKMPLPYQKDFFRTMTSMPFLTLRVSFYFILTATLKKSPLKHMTSIKLSLTYCLIITKSSPPPPSEFCQKNQFKFQETGQKSRFKYISPTWFL